MTQHNFADRNAKTDIVLILRPIEGTKPLNSGMRPDPRLFTGDNALHAKMDSQTCLWHLYMDSGVVPPSFKQQFTSFTRAYNFVKDYYAKRNIEIKEIKD